MMNKATKELFGRGGWGYEFLAAPSKRSEAKKKSLIASCQVLKGDKVINT